MEDSYDKDIMLVGITAPTKEDWTELELPPSCPIRTHLTRFTPNTNTKDEETDSESSDWDAEEDNEDSSFQQHLEGLRNFLVVEDPSKDAVPLRWRLTDELVETKPSPQVVRYPKPSKLFSLVTEDNQRFMQEIALEKWLHKLCSSSSNNTSESKRKHLSKPGSNDWLNENTIFANNLYCSRKYGECVDSIMRSFRMLGSVAYSIKIKKVALLDKKKFPSVVVRGSPDEELNTSSAFASLIEMFELGSDALARTGEAFANGEHDISRGTSKLNIPGCILTMIQDITLWTESVDVIKGLGHYMRCLEAHAVAHQLATCVLDYSTYSESLDRRASSDMSKTSIDMWTFASPPPESSAWNYLSHEARLAEAVLGQLCVAYVDSTSIKDTTALLNPVTIQVDCLCGIQLFLQGMSPLTGTETNKLQDALDQLQLELENWMVSSQVVEYEILELLSDSEGVGMCIGIAHKARGSGKEHYIEKLCKVNPTYRMELLMNLYTRIPTVKVKAKAGFVLARYLWDEKQDSETAEELLFEALFILKSIKSLNDELATNIMVFYGDILEINNKYKFAIGAYESAVKSYEIREHSDYKILSRKLCTICVENMDWDRALVYHLKILHSTKLETNMNEFVYISERVAMMLLDQYADFAQAESYLKTALSYLEQDPSGVCANAHQTSLRVKLEQRLAHVYLVANRAEDAAILLSKMKSRHIHILLSLARCCLKLRWLADCTYALDQIAQDVSGGKWCDPFHYLQSGGKGVHSRPRPNTVQIFELLSLLSKISLEVAFNYVTLRARCVMYQGYPSDAVEWIDQALRLELNLRLTLKGRLYYYRGRFLLMYIPFSYKNIDETIDICSDCGGRRKSLNRGAFRSDPRHGYLHLNLDCNYSEKAVTSLWSAYEYFVLVEDTLWQAKTLSHIAEIQLADFENQSLERVEKTAVMALDLCADIGYAPLMLRCILNMAEVRHLQQKEVQALWHEALSLLNTLYLTSFVENDDIKMEQALSTFMFLSSSNKQADDVDASVDEHAVYFPPTRVAAMYTGPGLTTKILQHLTRLVRLMPDDNFQYAPGLFASWNFLADECYSQYRCCTRVMLKEHQESTLYNDYLEYSKYSSSEDQGCVTCPQMPPKRKTYISLWSCFHKLKLLSRGEIGHTLHMQEVHSQNMELLRKIMEFGKNTQVVSKAATTNDSSLLFIGWGQSLLALSDKQLQLNPDIHLSLTREDRKPTIFGLWDLLKPLGVGNLLRVAATVLSESPIIVISSLPHVRARSIEALLALISPFHWTFPVIPNIPGLCACSFGDMLKGQPYIVGLHPTSVASFLKGDQQPVIVNLDGGWVQFPKNSLSFLPVSMQCHILSHSMKKEPKSWGPLAKRQCQSLYEIFHSCMVLLMKFYSYFKGKLLQFYDSLLIEDPCGTFIRTFTKTNMFKDYCSGKTTKSRQILDDHITEDLSRKAKLYRSLVGFCRGSVAWVSVCDYVVDRQISEIAEDIQRCQLSYLLNDNKVHHPIILLKPKKKHIFLDDKKFLKYYRGKSKSRLKGSVFLDPENTRLVIPPRYFSTDDDAKEINRVQQLLKSPVILNSIEYDQTTVIDDLHWVYLVSQLKNKTRIMKLRFSNQDEERLWVDALRVNLMIPELLLGILETAYRFN